MAPCQDVKVSLAAKSTQASKPVATPARAAGDGQSSDEPPVEKEIIFGLVAVLHTVGTQNIISYDTPCEYDKLLTINNRDTIDVKRFLKDP